MRSDSRFGGDRLLAIVLLSTVAAAAGCGDDGSERMAITPGSGGAGGAGAGGAGGVAGTGGVGGGGTGGAAGTGGTGGSTTPGPFTSQGDGTVREAECHVASDGARNLAAAWIGVRTDSTSTNGYAISRDNGDTWSPPRHVEAPDGRVSSDPVLAIDGQGTTYLTFVGFRRQQSGIFPISDMHVYVSKLDPATGVFGAPIPASDDGQPRDGVVLDKPWITTDADDNVLVTYLEASTQHIGLMIARSTDHAQTFSQTTVTPGMTFNNLAYPCVDRSHRGGPIFIVFAGRDLMGLAGASLGFAKSLSGGTSWTMGAARAPGGAVYQDPSCAVHGDTFYMLYAQGADQGGSMTQTPLADSIALVRSTDGGASFGTPVTVSAGGTSDKYLLAQLAVAPTGRVEVVYYQGQVGQPAQLVRAWTSNFATWTRATLAMPGSLTNDRAAAGWFGDYIGLAAPGGFVYTTYADNSSGRSHIQFARAQVP
jgi:hypothetical protein